jgi:hypothetical protein
MLILLPSTYRSHSHNFSATKCFLISHLRTPIRTLPYHPSRLFTTAVDATPYSTPTTHIILCLGNSYNVVTDSHNFGYHTVEYTWAPARHLLAADEITLQTSEIPAAHSAVAPRTMHRRLLVLLAHPPHRSPICGAHSARHAHTFQSSNTTRAVTKQGVRPHTWQPL